MLPAQTPTPTPPAAVPPHPELPPGIDLQLADRVIYLCISDKLRPNDIADRLEISLFTVGQIIHSPYGVATRDLLKDLDEIRAEIHTRHQRMRAMAATADLCETAEREETRRLAAAAIIRGVPYYPSEREQRTAPAKRRSTSKHVSESPAPQPTPIEQPKVPVQPDDQGGMTPEEAAIIREIESSTRRLAATAERLCATRPAEPRTAPTAALSSAPRVSSHSATASPAPAATPAPTLPPRAGAPNLLNHLAARMAAPDSPATLNTRARDAPQAA